MQGRTLIGKKTSSGVNGPPMDEDDSSTTTYSSKSRSENQDMNPSKISRSAPWNKYSFLDKLLCRSLDLPEQFLADLQDGMYIANTERFLGIL
jgi:hypothetical protein